MHWKNALLSSVIGFFFLVIIMLIVSGRLTHSKSTIVPIKKNPSPYDQPIVVQRFRCLMNMWTQISSDPDFKKLAGNLMRVNSNIKPQDSNRGNKGIYQAFIELDQYVRQHVPREIRITLIYTDGILFYDSVVPMDKIYFMDGRYPKPVSLYTLGSPLKDHNTLPEVSNSLAVNHKGGMSICGMKLNDKVYRELLDGGFGFYERMSSSLNQPFAYVAKFMHLDNPDYDERGFVDGCTLRLGINIQHDEKQITMEPGRF